VFIPDEPPLPKELPWQVTPESVASIPPEVAAPLPPKQERRTPAPAFRLLDEGEAEKKAKPKPKPRRRTRRGPWLKRLVVLAVLAGVVGGGYWYFVLKNPGKPPPWAGLVERAKKLVSGSTQPPGRRPPAPPPRAPRTTAPAPAATPPPAPVPVPVPVPVAQPAPVPAASPFARFDRLSDSLARVVRTFQDRAGLFQSGQVDCNGLANGLAAVESTWLVYFNERKARLASLDQPRVERDQTLYAAVDGVARRFENSGCPRP
jgi:hypothetical protein